MLLAFRFQSTLLEKEFSMVLNYQINSHGFTLTYADIIVIHILTVCTNIVEKYLNSLSADMGENTTLKSFPASHRYH